MRNYGVTNRQSSLSSGSVGVDFDQSAIPTPTAVGQIWRERSVSGLITETWTWNGSLWLSPARYFYNPTLSLATGSNWYALPYQRWSGIVVEELRLSLNYVFGTVNDSNYWSYTPIITRGNSWTFALAAYQRTTSDGDTNSAGDFYTYPINTAYTNVTAFNLFTAKTGTPPDHAAGSGFVLQFREYR